MRTKRWRILVLSDDCGWNNFMAGFCDTEEIANQQRDIFSRSIRGRAFTIVMAPE